MNYPQSLVSSVLREMEERTRRRQQLLERRVEEVCRRSEDIAAIQRQLEESAPRAIRRALESGEDPEQVMRAAARDHAKLIEQRAALLEGAGFTRDYLTLEPDCPACRDTGYCGLQLCRCVQRRCAALLAEQLSPTGAGQRGFRPFLAGGVRRCARPAHRRLPPAGGRAQL